MVVEESGDVGPGLWKHCQMWRESQQERGALTDPSPGPVGLQKGHGVLAWQWPCAQLWGAVSKALGNETHKEPKRPLERSNEALQNKEEESYFSPYKGELCIVT